MVGTRPEVIRDRSCVLHSGSETQAQSSRLRDLRLGASGDSEEIRV
jgi:hypothetical protein